ncbi:MAG: hypothetical protein ACE5HC_14445 [Candidatus Binatia bacterium]
MIDTGLANIRCRAAQDIPSHHGVIRLGTQGIIEYEIEKPAYHLIHVRWDNGLTLNVPAREIEVIDGDVVWQ